MLIPNSGAEMELTFLLELIPSSGAEQGNLPHYTDKKQQSKGNLSLPTNPIWVHDFMSELEKSTKHLYLIFLFDSHSMEINAEGQK